MWWLLVMYLGFNLFLLGVGIGIGFLLRWILPAVDLGVGILIGVVATVASVNFFLRINKITDQIEDAALLREILSRRAIHAAEPVPTKRSGKRKTSDTLSPR